MLRWLPALILSVLLISCVSTTARSLGGIRVETNVPEATLIIDEEPRGPVKSYETHYVRLPPGAHRLTLEHPGYFTEYIDVDVVENMGMAVRLEMRQRPSE